MNIRMILMAAVAALLAPIALAHHSTAAYDANKIVTLEGKVTEVQWVNPHTFINMAVAEPNGKQIAWSILSGTPTLNVRNGWKYNDVKKGDTVTVVIHPNRDSKSHSGILRRITLADGRTIAGPREFLTKPDVPASNP